MTGTWKLGDTAPLSPTDAAVAIGLGAWRFERYKTKKSKDGPKILWPQGVDKGRATAMIELNCYLADLFTNEAARGKGVGKQLIEAVYDRARLAGCSRVYWQTHETNAVAQVLYNKVAERSGFIVYRKTL